MGSSGDDCTPHFFNQRLAWEIRVTERRLEQLEIYVSLDQIIFAVCLGCFLSGVIFLIGKTGNKDEHVMGYFRTCQNYCMYITHRRSSKVSLSNC